jgi:hypothetical protein
MLVYVFLLNPIFQIKKYSDTNHFTRKQLDVKGSSIDKKDLALKP